MKKIYIILLMATAILVNQACGTKKETSEEKSSESENSEAAGTSASTKEIKLTLAERRAKLEKENVIREERRNAAREERIKSSLTYKDASGNMVYNKAEVDPSFEGGKKALSNYLNENIQFPKSAEEEQLEGMVFVDFVVAETGKIREVAVSDAPGEEVDQRFRDEAIRVVSAMPNWIPGKQHGKPVPVNYTLPISFQLR